MPRMNGFEVLEMVRKHNNIEEFPVLIITGQHAPEALTKALSKGANDFITKPFNQIEVSLRVGNLLKVRQAFKFQKQTNELLEKKVQLYLD